MKKRKDFYSISTVVFIFLTVGSLIFTACKSNEVSPIVPAPNPPSAPSVALTLNGTVIDSKTSAGLSGATVQILKTDGTIVTTLSSGNSGKFSYDISTVNASSLKVTATATGYGFSFATAAIDIANNSARAVTLPLDKLVTVSVNVTPASGGSTTTTSTESKTTTPVGVSVPSGAVSTNTTVQVSAVPVNNVPAPSNAASSTQVGVANLQPAGISFLKSVILTFPLPYKFKPNDQIALNQFINNIWQFSGINATVDNTGYIATASITTTGEYALLDNTSITGTTSTFKVTKVLDQQAFTFSSGTLHTELPGVITYTVTATNVITEAPTDEWIFNTLEQRYGVQFSGVTAPGSVPFTVIFDAEWPGATANPYKANPDGSGNAQRPGESGSWSLKITYESYTDTFANVVLDNPGYWQITVTGSATSWRELQRNWVWTAHNQGGVFEF